MKLSIIIPVYNERTTIEEIIERVFAVELNEFEKEIVICDDCSSDGSAELIELQRIMHGNLIKVYTSPVNLGKGAAIRCGLRYATGDIILIQDADLELNPEEYIDLLKPIVDRDVAVVFGSRFKNSAHGVPFRTILANKFLTLLTNLLFGASLSDMETAYKVFRADVIKNIQLECVGFNIEPEITAKLLRKRYKIHEIAVSYNPRMSNEGKKIKFKDGMEAIWTLFKYRFFE